MWNKALGRQIETYPTAVLSIVESDGYPSSVRCQVRAEMQLSRILIPDPPAQAKIWRGRACLLFHEHDARLESLRQMVALGNLSKESEDGAMIFLVEKFVTANGRANSDQMPHASDSVHMLKFFFIGWRNARVYLAKRGILWPPIPYDEILRLIDEKGGGNESGK